MSLAKQAFQRLFPEKEANYSFKVKYSAKFKAYNANVKYTKDNFQFNLSKKWKKVSKDIQIGLMQSLLLKVFKEKMSTIEIDLYNSFLKKVHFTIPKTSTDEFLEQSFNRINEKYLNDLIEIPNLKWHNSMNRLGSYEYGSDTISISKVLLELGPSFVDYVMYHEMLHKKHKFSCKNNRSFHHTKEFKEDERRFEDHAILEAQLNKHIKKRKHPLLARIRLK